MNLILSFFLCLALTFSGTAGLPAEPETATTLTIRNVRLVDEDCDIALNPEARITAAIGMERAALQFAIVNGERTLLPMSADVTNGELRFVLSGNGWAYSVSDATLREISGLRYHLWPTLDLAAALLADYGALMGAAYDDAFDEADDEVFLNAWIQATGAAIEETEVEVDGQTLPARRFQADLDLEVLLNLLDALDGCGIEPVENILRDILAAFNKLLPANSESFIGFYEALDAMSPDFVVPAELVCTEDMSYAMVEFDVLNIENYSYHARYEYTVRGDEIILVQATEQDDAATTATFVYTGSRLKPETFHTECETIRYDADGVASTIRYTVDSVTEDGLRSANGLCTFSGEDAFLPENFQLALTLNERAEADGSVTADVVFDITANGESGTISFELNRAEGAYIDPFEGLDIREVTADIIENTDEPTVVTASLAADAAQLSLDAMQLMGDESVQALMEMIEGADDDEIEADLDYSYQIVETLEDAAAIYGGEMPVYTAPEGYEIDRIIASASYLSIEYSSEDLEFEIYAGPYFSDYSSKEYVYRYFDGEIAPADGYTLITDPLEDGTVAYVTVYPPYGCEPFQFMFFDNVTMDELAALLIGLGNK